MVSLSLAIAGSGFAGFATAVRASMKIMSNNDLKSKFILGLSTGGLVLATTSQLIEYLYFKISYNDVLYYLSRLQRSLTDLLISANRYNDRLAELIGKIGRYLRGITKDLHLIQNNFVDSKLFSFKVSGIVDETEALIVALKGMEVYTDNFLEHFGMPKSALPEIHSL